MFCTQCGAEVKFNEQKFCEKCGFKLFQTQKEENSVKTNDNLKRDLFYLNHEFEVQPN